MEKQNGDFETVFESDRSYMGTNGNAETHLVLVLDAVQTANGFEVPSYHPSKRPFKPIESDAGGPLAVLAFCFDDLAWTESTARWPSAAELEENKLLHPAWNRRVWEAIERWEIMGKALTTGLNLSGDSD